VLFADSRRELGASTLRTAIFLERQFRLHALHRNRLVFDSRFAPPAKKSSAFVHVYASVRGAFALTGAPPTTGPQCFILDESEFDRVGPASQTFRSWGAPCVIVELRVPASMVRRPIGLRHGAIALAPRTWDAYTAIDRALEAAQPSTADVQALMHALAADDVIAPQLASSTVTDEPERFTRLWNVMRPLYESYATSTSLKQLAAIIGMSLRQLGRDLNELTRTFGLFGAGFRDAMRVLRLRAAVLMLSAPSITPTEVARAVGYGSLDAMGRGFRDAALPAPSVVQDAVRYTE
jgi:AraC-like DNA-binding protein